MSVQSKNVLNDKGQQYHICCGEGDVGRYVILPGDPFRTDLIASYLDDAKLVAHNREHKTWTGSLNGVKVSVTSTGMGGPSAAIAVEELIHCGADTFIRIGTAGRVCDESWDQTLDGVVVTAAVRDEGTTIQYIPLAYPAVANRHIVSALADAANAKGLKCLEGIAHCKDSFYGQHDPNSLPNKAILNANWEAWRMGNVVCSEMETAALFTVASIRGCRAGAFMNFTNMTNAIETVIDGLKRVIEADKNA